MFWITSEAPMQRPNPDSYVVLYAFKLARLERAVAELRLTRSDQGTARKIVPGRSHDGEA